MCYSGKFTEQEVYTKAVGKGGFVAYLNTNDARDVLKLAAEGNKEAQICFDAFIYQISKSIGEMATVLEGKVDRIIFTGGIAYSEKVIDELKKRVGWIAPITIYPGEDELLALAQGAIRAMTGEEEAKEYI
jgi:butyrate kinase